MQKMYLLQALTIILLISCQREIAFELSEDELLVRRVDESVEPGVPGKATTISDYTYNAGKKLTGYEYTATHENVTRSGATKYTRDDKGRIISFQTTSQRLKDGLPYTTPEGPAFDTSFIEVVYKDESQRINYVKHSSRLGDKTAMDSLIYEYDNNDHVKKTTGYYLPMAVHQPGEALLLYGYTDWVFDTNGSLKEQEIYGKDNAGFTLQIRYRFEYDDKVNPLFWNEDVFLAQWFDISPHNVVKQTVYIAATGETYDNTATYQYRPDNKPSSVAYFSPPTVVSAARQSAFHYK